TGYPIAAPVPRHVDVKRTSGFNHRVVLNEFHERSYPGLRCDERHEPIKEKHVSISEGAYQQTNGRGEGYTNRPFGRIFISRKNPIPHQVFEIRECAAGGESA